MEGISACGGCKREGVRVESVRVEGRACRRGKGGLVQAFQLHHEISYQALPTYGKLGRAQE